MSRSDSASRSQGIGNLLQSAVFAGLAWYLWPRWSPAAGIALACVVAQVVGGVSLLAGRGPRWAWWGSALSLVGVGLILGLQGYAAAHVMTHFGADAARTGRGFLLGSFAAIPWLAAFPLWQVLAGRRWPPAAMLLAVLLPTLWGAWDARPVQTWPSQRHLIVEAARGAFERWQGGEAALPTGAGPATVLLTPWSSGKAGDAVRGDGADLGAAVQDALSRLPAPRGERPALVLDVARARYAKGLVPAASGGGLGAHGGLSPSVAWHRTRGREVAPRWRVPVPNLGGRAPVAFDSAVADSDGAHYMRAGWAQGAPLIDPESVLDAALAAGRMLVANQAPDGSYSYVVQGPSGRHGTGYNLPRHAGVTWFLARLAERTGDEQVGQAADRGLAWMAQRTTTLDDGRAFVRDPRRGDAKVWVGTTSLAALAAVVRGHPLAVPWGRFVASSVDERGQVRGEADKVRGVFKVQPQNPYGQGQATLALAALVRAGHDELTDPLRRAGAFVDGPYGPLGANRLVVLDEHWSCLAALASRDALGTPSGWGLCRAYLAHISGETPRPSADLGPSAGSAGGAAEAVVAGAMLDGSATLTRRALRYGDWFLRSAYLSADAPFLGRPPALIGGFRDTPYHLDVRMDAVQHIGCALLGIEALLRGVTAPGSAP